MKKLLTVIALGSATLLSAQQYDSSDNSSYSSNQSQDTQPNYRINIESDNDSQDQVDQQAQYSDPNNRWNQNVMNNNRMNKYPQDSAATPQDRGINAKIRSKLKDGRQSKGFDSVTLKTSNGNVVVSGTVNSSDDLRKINDKVKGIDGVKSVNNQIEIKP
jgi:osmotically-inducible protein OsmY